MLIQFSSNGVKKCNSATKQKTTASLFSSNQFLFSSDSVNAVKSIILLNNKGPLTMLAALLAPPVQSTRDKWISSTENNSRLTNRTASGIHVQL